MAIKICITINIKGEGESSKHYREFIPVRESSDGFDFAFGGS